MVSLAANWDPAGRRECNDAHLHGGIELDDRPDLLRGWRRFDYGHRIPVGNTGSRMNTRRVCRKAPKSFLMCDWEGCTTGTIGLPNPKQPSVAKTSAFLHPSYIQVYRVGVP